MFLDSITYKSKYDIILLTKRESENMLFKETVISGISVKKAVAVDSDFHARYSCIKKEYVYKIWNAPYMSPFWQGLALHYPKPIDENYLDAVCTDFIGTYDFSAFCGNPQFKKSTVRFVRSVKILKLGNEVRLIFTGNGFIHNQVRIMVGTLIEVGRGERAADSIPALFGGKRSDAGFLAPAQGLCLMEVTY